MSYIISNGPSSDDYFLAVSIVALVKILKDQSLNLQHSTAITAIMYIFKTLGLKCVSFLPQVRFSNLDFPINFIDNQVMSAKYARLLFSTTWCIGWDIKATHKKLY